MNEATNSNIYTNAFRALGGKGGRKGLDCREGRKEGRTGPVEFFSITGEGWEELQG